MEIASHYRQLLRELNEQRQHGILCDACVIVDGKIFKAHKNVLLGSSRYFKTLYCQVRDCSIWENWSVECFCQYSFYLCVLPVDTTQSWVKLGSINIDTLITLFGQNWYYAAIYSTRHFNH